MRVALVSIRVAARAQPCSTAITLESEALLMVMLVPFKFTNVVAAVTQPKCQVKERKCQLDAAVTE
jgi:hypothetical protein